MDVRALIDRRPAGVGRVALPLLCVGMALAGACRSKDAASPATSDAGPTRTPIPRSPPPLGEVRLRYVAAPDITAELPRSVVAPIVRERLLATGAFGERGAGAYQGEASVLYALQEAGAVGGPLVRAAVTISLESATAPKLHAQIVAEKRLPAAAEEGAKRREALKAFLVRALTDAARLVAIQARLEHLPTSALVASVRDPDRDVRDYAVQILGARRAAEAVPALLDALSDRDAAVAQHAVGALEAIGDRRAVPRIIDLTRNQRGLLLHQLLYSLGSLGGREAEAFLWSVSEGHPEPAARRAAAEALARLRRKKARR